MDLGGKVQFSTRSHDKFDLWECILSLCLGLSINLVFCTRFCIVLQSQKKQASLKGRKASENLHFGDKNTKMCLCNELQRHICNSLQMYQSELKLTWIIQEWWMLKLLVCYCVAIDHIIALMGITEINLFNFKWTEVFKKNFCFFVLRWAGFSVKPEIVYFTKLQWIKNVKKRLHLNSLILFFCNLFC